MNNPQPIAHPHIGCEHCRGVSRNAIHYHRRGCATGKGGWSEAQRRGIEAIVTRVRQEERAAMEERGALELLRRMCP